MNSYHSILQRNDDNIVQDLLSGHPPKYFHNSLLPNAEYCG